MTLISHNHHPARKGTFLRGLLLLVVALVVVSCAHESVSPSSADLTPIILSIQPDSAYVGDEIVISGENFSPVSSANVVMFSGGVRGTVVAAAPTSLLVNVPANAATGNISVTVGAKTGESQLGFIVREADMQFAAINPPKVAKVGDVLEFRLNGRGTPDDAAKIVVKFGDVAGEVISYTLSNSESSRFSVRVPAGAVSGRVKVEARGKILLTTDELKIVTELLPFANCVVEISGLRVQMRNYSRTALLDVNGNPASEQITDDTSWTDFSLTIDTREARTGYMTPERHFVDNIYRFRYADSGPMEDVTQEITLEFDPADSALTSLAISNALTRRVQGGHSNSSRTESSGLVVKNLHKQGDNSYTYELTGDEVDSLIESLANSFSSEYHHFGNRERQSQSRQLLNYECPGTATITIRFFD